MRRMLVMAFIFASLLLACSDENTSTIDDSMRFRVDDSLLEAAIVDTTFGVQFNPPLHCKKMPQTFIDQVKQELAAKLSNSSEFPLEPAYIFMDQNTQFVCLFSALPAIQSDSLTLLYQQQLAEAGEATEIKHTQFTYNQFNIYQTLIINPEQVRFILLVPQSNNRSFRIDYVIPYPQYVNKIEAIESSIGSLTKC